MTLLLHLEAPLMSFGRPLVNNIGGTYPAPTLSMLTGLIANALGLEHRDAERIGAIQQSLRYAARRDREGEIVRDYQTVDLGQGFLQHTGWTTRGSVEARLGGNSTSTHIRERDYFADACFFVALNVSDECGFDEASVGDALQKPERPLFLGRKNCLPSARIMVGETADENVWRVLSTEPTRSSDERTVAAWGPVPGAPEDHHAEPWYDTRDWGNGVHTGKRMVARAQVAMKPNGDSNDA